NSLWVQVKLSVATVALQLAIGLGVALLLNAGSRFLEAVRTAFILPMVLPPIVVAVVWKVIFTPDVSPDRSAGALADRRPRHGAVGNRRRRHLGMVPVHDADGAGGIADDPWRADRCCPDRWRRPPRVVPLYPFSLYPPHPRCCRAVPTDRQHQGVPADLRIDQWRPRHRDRGDQLLRLCRIVQFLLLGLRQRDCDLDGRRRVAVELDHRPSRRGGGTR